MHKMDCFKITFCFRLFLFPVITKSVHKKDVQGKKQTNLLVKLCNICR